MPIKVDLSQASNTVPDGLYKCAISDAEMKESNSSDFEYILWTLTIQEGPHAGQKLFERTSLSPNAAFRLNAFLVAAGIQMPETAEEKASFEFEPRDCLGVSVFVETKTETYEGTSRSVPKKIRSFTEGPGGGTPPASGRSRRS